MGPTWLRGEVAYYSGLVLLVKKMVKRRLIKSLSRPSKQIPGSGKLLLSLIESPEGEGSSLCAQPTMSDLTRRKEAQMVHVHVHVHVHVNLF
jgi:hypothetical protein